MQREASILHALPTQFCLDIHFNLLEMGNNHCKCEEINEIPLLGYYMLCKQLWQHDHRWKFRNLPRTACVPEISH